MPQRSAFFDAQNSDRTYASADFARLFASLTGRDGVIAGEGDELAVSPTSPESMAVQVGLGSAWIQGRHYNLYESPEVLAIAAAHPTLPRIDRIVVRMDTALAARTITVKVKQGTPGASPLPPSLERNSTAWEISLAQVYVAASATSITGADITDERRDESVCGYVTRRGSGYSVYNVREYGAVGDGLNDDRAAIQRAIDVAASAGGGIVFIPPGTYRITNGIDLKSGVVLAGAGASSVLLHWNTTEFNCVTAYRQTNVVVRDLCLDGNNYQGNNGVVFHESENCHAVNVLTKNWNGYHYWFFDSSHCTAYDCIADGVIDNGFEMLGAEYCSFVNCKAKNVTQGYAFNLWAGTKYSGCYACIAEMTVDPSTDIAGFKASTDDFLGGVSEVITFADCITLGGKDAIRVFGVASADGDTDPTKQCRQVNVNGGVFKEYSGYGVAAFNGVENLIIEGANFYPLSKSRAAISLQQAAGTVRFAKIKGVIARGGKAFLHASKVLGLSVEGNTIVDLRAPGEPSNAARTAIALFGCVGAKVTDNQMYNLGDSSATAFGVLLDSLDVPCEHCLVAHNVIYESRTGASRGLDYGIIDNGQNNWVSQNIVVNPITIDAWPGASANDPVRFQAAAHPDSAAGDVGTLVAEFNLFLQKLRDAGLLAT